MTLSNCAHRAWESTFNATTSLIASICCHSGEESHKEMPRALLNDTRGHHRSLTYISSKNQNFLLEICLKWNGVLRIKNYPLFFKIRSRVLKKASGILCPHSINIVRLIFSFICIQCRDGPNLSNVDTPRKRPGSTRHIHYQDDWWNQIVKPQSMHTFEVYHVFFFEDNFISEAAVDVHNCLQLVKLSISLSM